MDDSVLVLRTVSKNMVSYNGFTWPKSGYAEAKDWQPTFNCGNGLHGLLWGEGNGTYLDWSNEAVWLVVKVEKKNLLTGEGHLKDKCKFKCGDIVHCGNQKSATNYMQKNGENGKVITGITATAGDSGTATVGDYGTVTAGDYGTATAGDYGTVTAGDYGTATAGDRGTATAGYGGTATAGDYGTLILKFWDSKNNRQRIKVFYIGEDGAKANVAYKQGEDGNKIIEVEK